MNAFSPAEPDTVRADAVIATESFGFTYPNADRRAVENGRTREPLAPETLEQRAMKRHVMELV